MKGRRGKKLRVQDYYGSLDLTEPSWLIRPFGFLLLFPFDPDMATLAETKKRRERISRILRITAGSDLGPIPGRQADSVRHDWKSFDFLLRGPASAIGARPSLGKIRPLSVQSV
jgi:hypothetical protein